MFPYDKAPYCRRDKSSLKSNYSATPVPTRNGGSYLNSYKLYTIERGISENVYFLLSVMIDPSRGKEFLFLIEAVLTILGILLNRFNFHGGETAQPI